MDYQSFQSGGQEQNQTPVTPPSLEPVSKKNFTPKFIWVVVGLLVLGGTAYGGLWFWNDKNKEVVVPTFTPRPDPMADWQTYRNEEYGFEFKYPEDWHFKTNLFDNSFILLIDPPEVFPASHIDTDLPYAIRLTVYSDIDQLDSRNQSVASLDDFINKYSKPPVEDPNIVLGPYIQDVEIISQGNISWYKAKAGPNVFGGGEFYFAEDGDNNIYEIKSFNLVEQDWIHTDVFNQILSTFKFLR